MQGTQRYVIIAHIVFAFLLMATLGQLLGALFAGVGVNDGQLLGQQLTVTKLLGAVIGLGATVALYKNPKSIAYTNEVVAELHKVTWPTKKETQTATTVVIVTTLVMSVILFFIDNAWGALTGVFYK